MTAPDPDLRDELRKAKALSEARPDWTKRRMPTIQPEPTAEHIDAVADAPRYPIGLTVGFPAARATLTSTDPAVHAALAASLPAEVKAASLTDAELIAELRARGYGVLGEAKKAEEKRRGW